MLISDGEDQPVDERTAIAWLHRRAGFGLGPGELDAAAKDGLDATVDRLIDPQANGVAPIADPWAGQQFEARPSRAQAFESIVRWTDHLSTTTRPLESWMVWYWHGHFATSLTKVKLPQLMVGQLRTFRTLGLGPFPGLLRAVTVDPAMLVWLDGTESTATAPNENYGREVLELFALGQGSFAESEVMVGARALTGWRARPRQGYRASFNPGRHDDTRRRYLGQDGVHDLDTTIDAISAHPECAPFLARRLAVEVLGETAVDDGLVADLARRFAASGFDVRTLVRAILEAGLARLDGPAVTPSAVVLGPVAWLAAARRATGARPPFREVGKLLQAAGQVPMAPPNVGGWPGGQAWLESSTVVARYRLAGVVAAATPVANPARAAAIDGDDDRLADALGRPEGFRAATRAGLAAAGRAGGPPGVARLTLALASPDLTLG